MSPSLGSFHLQASTAEVLGRLATSRQLQIASRIVSQLGREREENSKAAATTKNKLFQFFSGRWRHKPISAEKSFVKSMLCLLPVSVGFHVFGSRRSEVGAQSVGRSQKVIG